MLKCRWFPTISTWYRILRDRVLGTATIVVRYNAQTVQYIVRVVIVRYRTTGKRLFTQQVLFIIHLSVIQHFYIICWIIYPHHQQTDKIIINHNQSQSVIVNHQTLYKLTISTTTNPPITTLYIKSPTHSFYLYHLTVQQNSATLLIKQVFDVWQASSTCNKYTN